MSTQLSKAEIKQVAYLLGTLAVREADKGNLKAEARIFKLIEKLEALK